MEPTTHGMDEAALRARLPVFVNSYNQLTYLRDTVDWFARHGFGDVTVLDNASRYPPLLDYFTSADFTAKARVIHLGGNLGPRGALARAVADPATDAGFIFTDPDLTLPEPPDPAMIATMLGIGRRHGVWKVGLALDIDPDRNKLDMVTYRTRTVAQVERKYWKHAVEDGVFKATTDTTFFLGVPQPGGGRFADLGTRQARIPSLRVGRPGFVALHRPWLKHDSVPAEETAFYYDTTQRYSTLVVAQKALKED